jgi:hypothetical protein
LKKELINLFSPLSSIAPYGNLFIIKTGLNMALKFNAIERGEPGVAEYLKIPKGIGMNLK